MKREILRPYRAQNDMLVEFFSLRFFTFATMNCNAAITSQTTAAPNNSGINKNEAQNISVPANSHQEQSYWPSVKP